MEDPSKFFNVVIDKTNQKLNSFQAQVIVLESQLQMALEEKEAYKNYAERLSGQSINLDEINIVKDNYALIQNQFQILQQENAALKIQVKSLVDGSDGSIKFVRDQNETLLQEIRRLKAEISNLSASK
jgi:phage shock protein A